MLILNCSSDLEQTISSKTNFASAEEKSRILADLRWIGLFSDEKITPRGIPLDTLCTTLEPKMHYGPEERDLVMLQHKFEIEWADSRKERQKHLCCVSTAIPRATQR